MGGVWSRSGSHRMPRYLVIPTLWLIGLWGSVGCSCGAGTQGNSRSVLWKSRLSSLLLEDRGTTQFAWMLHILYVFFEGGTNWLNSMNTSSGRSGGLSRHPYHSVFFQMQLNGLAFVRIEKEPLPFLSCMILLTTVVGKGTQIILCVAPQPVLAYSEFPEPAAFSKLCKGFQQLPRVQSHLQQLGLVCEATFLKRWKDTAQTLKAA